MKKILISFLSCILILVSSTSFARDKQPRRFHVNGDEEQSIQTSVVPLNTSKRKMSADERLARLERLINSQGLVDLLLKLDELQKEVQQLRGDVETQTYIAKDLKKRQRDLYIDIDRRLLQMERNGDGRSTSNTGRPYNSNRTAPPVVITPVDGVQMNSQVIVPAASNKPKKQVTASNNIISRPVDPIKEQNAYQKAFDLLRELRYEQAIKAYRQFIHDYPNGRYAHIAQYWLSEASYAQRHFKQAITDYQNLVNNYPNSPKLAEALLKIAYSYNALGQNKIAQETIEKLLRVYPNTTAAGQGQNLLKKIKSAKR